MVMFVHIRCPLKLAVGGNLLITGVVCTGRPVYQRFTLNTVGVGKGGGGEAVNGQRFGLALTTAP